MRAAAMVKDNKPKQSVKEPIKSLVKEIVGDTVYKLAKAAAQKTVVEFRDKLKEEAARRFEEELKKTAEKRLRRTAQKLGKEFTQDVPQETEYIKKLEEILSKRLRQYLSTISQGALKTMILAAAGAAIAGAVIAGGIVYICTQPPSPQPDLAIPEITFDVEPMPELYAIDIWPQDIWPQVESGLYQVTVHYVIANQGEAEAGQSTSCLLLNGEIIAENPVDPLPAGEEAEYEHTLSQDVVYQLLKSDYIEIELRADANGAVAESNEVNNTTTLIVNLSR